VVRWRTREAIPTPQPPPPELNGERERSRDGRDDHTPIMMFSGLLSALIQRDFWVSDSPALTSL